MAERSFDAAIDALEDTLAGLSIQQEMAHAGRVQHLQHASAALQREIILGQQEEEIGNALRLLKAARDGTF
jgi:hypothetical protein